MKKILLLGLLLSACSNLPPAIEDPPLYDLSLAQAKQNTAQFKEAPVRWGGVIVDVQNEENFSLVQILYYPLNYYGRPKLDQTNQGRFVVKSPEFLDPAIYTKDSEITVAGTLKGETERLVGNKKLKLPMLSPQQLHLWPAYTNYNNYYGGYGYGGYGGFGGFGYGYPYYGYYGSPFFWGGFYPYRR